MNKIFKPGKQFNNSTDPYDIEVGPGTRFFFFNSLLEKASYDKRAQQIVSKAYSAMNIGTDSISNNNEFERATYAAIELLYKMYEYEKNNEIKLFTPLLQKLSGTKYEAYSDCISDTAINYPKFMALLKLLEDDSKEGTALLNDYIKALKIFNDGANQIESSTQLFSSYTSIKQHRGEIVASARNNATKNTVSLLANEMVDLSSHSLTYKDSLTNWIKNNFLDAFLKDQTTFSINNNEYEALITNLLHKLDSILAYERQINKTEGVEKTLEELLNQLSEDNQEKTKIINSLKEFIKDELANLDLLDTLGAQLKRVFGENNQIQRSGERAFGFTQKNRRKLNDLLKSEALSNWEKADHIDIEIRDNNNNVVTKSLNKNILNTKVFKNYISTLTKALDLPEDSSLDEIIKTCKELLKKNQKRKDLITMRTEYNSAKFLNKIGNLLGTTLAGILDGSKNLKNDASLIFVIGQLETTIAQLDPQAKDMIQHLSKELLTQFNTQYYIKAKEKNIKGFDIEVQTNAEKYVEQEYIKNMQKILAQNNQFIQDYRDIFVIDDSAKFAETFLIKEGGFAGGSLGADVEAQIKNINWMLNEGGITPIDASRLLTAVLNAGDGMIGAFQRNALENYFTTVASMLMFKTGGNALQQWAANTMNKATGSLSKVHIYTFGTFYVPESFILLKTYEGLNKCMNILVQESDNYGSKVHIYNPVSEKNKYTKTFYSQTHETDVAIPDWEETSQQNYPSVKLEITLLGGFLDIVSKIMDEMQLKK